jgi:hypothetical protein
MIGKSLATVTLTMAFGAVALANENLEVVFEGCEPIEVLSNDESCGDGPDPVDLACRPDNGPVRWVPLSSIKKIAAKPGSPGGLHNCKAHPNQGYYQCIVTGNVGEEVSYNVTSTGDCALDPRIRIRR